MPVPEARSGFRCQVKSWCQIRRGAHGAVGIEAPDARAQDGAAGQRGVAAHHVHGAAAGEVDRAAREEQAAQVRALPARVMRR